MALVNLNDCWVGVQRRATNMLGTRDSWHPASYVTLTMDDGTKYNLSPSAAKALARALSAAARLIDPPKPRVKRS